MVSAEAWRRFVAERLSMNRQLRENKYWYYPVDDVGHENYVPVGRGVKSSDSCGVHISFFACKNVEAHKGVVVKGVDHTGKMAVRHRHLFCNNASCPVCFIRGWSVRRARSIEGRLREAVERGFGDVQHVVVSVAPEDYGLSEAVLRKKARAVLVSCGVSGGATIFHGYRLDRARHMLVWKPHYHVIGFVDDYDRCRHCVGADCYKGGGVMGMMYKAYRENGYIVRVLEERKTIHGTVWYQNHHATLRLGVKRFHVINWFGSCAYNNFKRKSVALGAETPCPVCHSGMVRVAYVGKKRIARRVGDADYQPWFDVDASESCDFAEVVGGSGEYG